MKIVFGAFVDTFEKLFIPNQTFLEFKDTANHTFFNELQNNNCVFLYKSALKTAFPNNFRDEKTTFSDEMRKFAFPFHKNRIFVAQLNLKKS